MSSRATSARKQLEDPPLFQNIPKRQQMQQETSDRKFSGVQASVLYQSMTEAPGVAEYDSSLIEEGFAAYSDGYTDLTDFRDQLTTTLYGHIGSGPAPQADVDTLLNDALTCIRVDDGPKLMDCLQQMQAVYKEKYPADVMFGGLFQDTLWGRVQDPDFKITSTQRTTALQLLAYYHKE
jgi:hypothetical protein